MWQNSAVMASVFEYSDTLFINCLLKSIVFDYIYVML